MELFGPIRWRFLGVLAALLGGPTMLLTHPRPTVSAFAAVGVILGARAFWRRLEPIPPELASPDRPLGLPPPSGATAPLRPEPEAVDLAGAARALRRSLGLAQTYARTALVFLALAAGTFVAGAAVGFDVDLATMGIVSFAAWIFFLTALALGTVGVGLMVRDSRRDAREAKLDG